MTPEGSISVEPPAWCASQFYAKALPDTTTNATSNGTRRTLLSTDIKSSDHPLSNSDHPLHNGLLTGFSISPEALEAHKRRQLTSTFFDPFNSVAFQVFARSVIENVTKAQKDAAQKDALLAAQKDALLAGLKSSAATLVNDRMNNIRLVYPTSTYVLNPPGTVYDSGFLSTEFCYGPYCQQVSIANMS